MRIINIRVDNRNDLDALSKRLGVELKDNIVKLEYKDGEYKPKYKKTITQRKKLGSFVGDWYGMPKFTQEKLEPFAHIKLHIPEDTEPSVFSDILEQPITHRTKSIWYPKLVRGINSNKRYTSSLSNVYKPKYPVYIVSKGRWHSRLTVLSMERMGVPYKVIIEATEYDQYAKVIDPKNLLVLPYKYLDEYDTFDDLGDTKSKGPGAARNFAMDHSTQHGHKRHWVMDDNLDDFHRLNNNMKLPVRTGVCLRAAEDFVDRYTNVPIAGLNYYSFCKTTDRVDPYVLNTRIYSCLLIDNNIGLKWRGRYNEDTDICLRVLKRGECTIQFNAFLCGKVTTQRMTGGNTKEFYDEEGTYNKSKMIEDMHPDVAKVVHRFSRIHHYVDYTPFKDNKLIAKTGLTEQGNEYGMYIVTVDNENKYNR